MILGGQPDGREREERELENQANRPGRMERRIRRNEESQMTAAPNGTTTSSTTRLTAPPPV